MITPLAALENLIEIEKLIQGMRPHQIRRLFLNRRYEILKDLNPEAAFSLLLERGKKGYVKKDKIHAEFLVDEDMAEVMLQLGSDMELETLYTEWIPTGDIPAEEVLIDQETTTIDLDWNEELQKVTLSIFDTTFIVEKC